MDTQFDTLVGKRGSGKTFKALMRLAEAALERPHGRYLFVGPSYRSTELMTSMLAEHPFPMGKVRSINKTTANLRLTNDSTLRFFGEDGIDTLRGLHFDGVVADATENWTTRDQSIATLISTLNPGGIFIETRFE